MKLLFIRKLKGLRFPEIYFGENSEEQLGWFSGFTYLQIKVLRVSEIESFGKIGGFVQSRIGLLLRYKIILLLWDVRVFLSTVEYENDS